MSNNPAIVHLGTADTEALAHGTVITFTRPVSDIGADDVLMLRSRNGEALHLVPTGTRPDGGTYVSLDAGPGLSLSGWLEQIDDLRWKFQLGSRHRDMMDFPPEPES